MTAQWTGWTCGRCRRVWLKQPRWHRHWFVGWSWHEVTVQVNR